jgi:serine/threonine protein kinase
MDPQRWIRIESLYHATLKQPPAERAGYLAEACGDEPELRREVESLLACADMELNSPVARGKRWPSGFHLGSYEIIDALGVGGMGEVYRARDLKLKREVAIKTLPEEFTQDSDHVSRFQREAEVLASLNHPNIANIYHLEEQNGSRYLVLELVDGETLAERISRGPIPVDEALPIAQRIAEALEAAHEKGIIHRDLKPANVKITTDGTVKVLDFGLAKAIKSVSSTPALSNSPTMLSGTIPGMILGTAAYMSPEQARGRQADPRSDIFSFGCVLYEMLCGIQAFQSESLSDVLASVMKVEPDFDRLPKNLNSGLYELVRRCLVKLPRNRWQAIGDVRVELERLIADPVGVVSPSVAPGRAFRRLRFITVTLAAALIAALVPATSYFLRHPEEKAAIRVEMPAPGIQPADFPSISPDGQYVAYRAQFAGKSAIWIRPMSEAQAQPLVGTENGTAPFWSPDSRHIAFVADGKLKTTSIFAGGPAATLTPAETDVIGYPGTWNRDGIILFCVARSGPPSLAPILFT